ncbi:MAG: RNA methyltransferase [bacterium]|nr:RNA methyltransferase [bacterium]
MALASPCRVLEVVVSMAASEEARTLAEQAATAGYPVLFVADTCFRKVSALRHSDGIAAIVEVHIHQDLPPSDEQPVIVTWQLQDPGNLGSIVRSATAMGCRRIVTVEPSVDALHPLCIRATAGTLFLSKIWQLDAAEARAWLAAQSPRVAVLSARGTISLQCAAATPPQILLVGNEARGVPDDVTTGMHSVAIPMAPEVESLNVNAAAAIALYTLWGSRLPRTSPQDQ